MVIARLARKAYPHLLEGVLEELAREVFVDGIRDVEMKQALRLVKLVGHLRGFEDLLSFRLKEWLLRLKRILKTERETVFYD